MRFVALVYLSFLAIGAAMAAEPARPSTSPSLSEVLPEPVACPAANCSEAERIRHLLEAAKHLLAAGKHDDANQLRAEAESARQRLLAGKLAELANLQAEIEQLRGELAAPAQICLEFKVVALSSKALREADIDLELANESALARILRGELREMSARHTQRQLVGFVEKDDSALRVLDGLCEQGLVKILAEPKVTTLSGRTVMFQTGGVLPIGSTLENAQDRSCSVRFECRPLLSADGLVRLCLRCNLNRQTPQPRDLQTAVLLPLGQGLVLVGLAANGNLIPGPAQSAETAPSQEENDETEFLILVKTSLVEPEAGLTDQSIDRDRMAERVHYDLPVAPSSRRKPHSPRPFQVPSYQTPIRK